MEILDALQDIRTRNARNERVDESQVMEELRKERERKEALLKESDPEEIERKRALEEDEKLVRRYFNKMQDIEVEEEIEGRCHHRLSSDPQVIHKLLVLKSLKEQDRWMKRKN